MSRGAWIACLYGSPDRVRWTRADRAALCRLRRKATGGPVCHCSGRGRCHYLTPDRKESAHA